MNEKPELTIVSSSKRSEIHSSEPNGRIKPTNTNGSDGGDNMSKYVTHQEFNSAMKDLDHRFDLLDANLDTKFEKVNTKFERQKVWFYGTGISIVLAMIAIVNFFK